MKFNFENIKNTFMGFNTYQKAAAVVLTLAVPMFIGMGVATMSAGGTDSGSSSSLPSSSIVSQAPSSSSEMSSSSVSKEAVVVTLKPSSVEEDLEVQVVGPDGNMIVGPEFKLIVKGVKNGYNKTWKVNDGFLRLTKLPSGDYTVTIEDMEGYVMPDQAVKITVAKKVAYKEVDVSDKVVDESKVDVSKEDAAYDDQVSKPATTPAPIKDTVEYVASSQKTERKEVEETVIRYKPEKILDDGTMVNHAGVSSGLYPVYDDEGYLIGAYKYETVSTASQAAEVNILPVQLMTFHAFALENSLGNSDIMPVDETDSSSESTSQPESSSSEAESSSSEAESSSSQESSSSVAQSSSSVAQSSSSQESSSESSSSESSSSEESSPSQSSGSTSSDSSSTSQSSSSQSSSSASSSSTASSSSSAGSSSEAEKVKVEVEIFDAEGNPIKDSLGNTLVKLTEIEIKYTVEKDVTTYYGWQTIDGDKYYFDKNGEKVTGTQTIQGITYYFDKTGKMGNRIGIDISKYQPNIDWKTVKDSGVEFVIIRAGYRGYGSGALVEDPYFKTHIKGATSVGLKVGVYVFSQAITTQEAVEEASLALQLVKGYNIQYPIFFDTEYSTSAKTGRADHLSQSQRTTIAKAFCETIQNAGYNAGIYASKTWFYYQLDYSQISQYDIWVAHYASSTDFKYRYDIWQYTGTGTCAGVAGAVDLNIGYTAY